MVPCPNARTQIHITWHSRYHKEYLWHKNITDKSLKKHDEKEWWNDWLQTVWKKSHQKHTAEARLNTQAERTPNSSTKGKYQKHGKAAEHLENTRTMPGECPENDRRMPGEWPGNGRSNKICSGNNCRLPNACSIVEICRVPVWIACGMKRFIGNALRVHGNAATRQKVITNTYANATVWAQRRTTVQNIISLRKVVPAPIWWKGPKLQTEPSNLPTGGESLGRHLSTTFVRNKRKTKVQMTTAQCPS